MHDQDTINRFIEMRSKGFSYVNIHETLGIAKNTIILWSRKYHDQIQNLRAIEFEAIAERAGACRCQRNEAAGNCLSRIEHELANRDLSKVPTDRLIALASRLRRELAHDTPIIPFTTPLMQLPPDEIPGQSLDWQA